MSTVGVVTDHPESSRYEIHVDGRRAGIASYARHGQRVDVLHTEIYPEFEGHGLASQLARGLLDDLARRGLEVTPSCPYLASYIRKHPDDIALVDEAHRGAFAN
jgi:predicted GNAT family acetyltransferase